MSPHPNPGPVQRVKKQAAPGEGCGVGDQTLRSPQEPLRQVLPLSHTGKTGLSTYPRQGTPSQFLTLKNVSSYISGKRESLYV